MPKKPRNIEITKRYNISSNRFKELYYYALQYQEWKDELKYKYDTSKAMSVSGMPISNFNGSNSTEDAAVKCAELSHKINTVEAAARLADPDLYKYILKAVTSEGINYNYLKTVMDIPCSKNTFYDRRRKFYWILAQNMDEKKKNEK